MTRRQSASETQKAPLYGIGKKRSWNVRNDASGSTSANAAGWFHFAICGERECQGHPALRRRRM